MARKRYKAEEIVAKLRQVDVLDVAGTEHGGCDPPDRRERGDLLSLAPGIWRPEDRIKRLKEVELENSRLRKAVSDLTLDKLLLQDAARGNF
jgi:putative transposase